MKQKTIIYYPNEWTNGPFHYVFKFTNFSLFFTWISETHTKKHKTNDETERKNQHKKNKTHSHLLKEEEEADGIKMRKCKKTHE